MTDPKINSNINNRDSISNQYITIASVSEEEEDFQWRAEESMTWDSIIDSYFQEELQRRRFKIEAGELMNEQGLIGVSVYLEGSPFQRILEVVIGAKWIDDQDIFFKVKMDPINYPNKGTIINCLTKVTFPSLNDQRNYLVDILKHKWHKSVTLSIIGIAITEFVEELKHNEKNLFYLQRLGQFQLGSLLTEEQLEANQSFSLFSSSFYNPKSPKQERKTTIVLTESHFQLYEMIQKNKKQYMRLIFWSDIQAIIKIIMKREDQSIMTFFWRNQQDILSPIEQRLRVVQFEKLLKSILANIKNILAVKILSNSYSLMEANFQQNMQNSQLSLASQAFIYQKQLQQQEDEQTVQKLQIVYNNLIDYYSQLNDYVFTDYYLNMLHQLNAQKQNKSPSNNNNHKNNIISESTVSNINNRNNQIVNSSSKENNSNNNNNKNEDKNNLLNAENERNKHRNEIENNIKINIISSVEEQQPK